MFQVIGYFTNPESKKLTFSEEDSRDGMKHIIVLEKNTRGKCSEFQTLTLQLVKEESDTSIDVLRGRFDLESVDKTILKKITFTPRDGVDIEEIDMEVVMSNTSYICSSFEFSKDGEEDNNSETDIDGHYFLCDNYFIRNKYKSSKK